MKGERKREKFESIIEIFIQVSYWNLNKFKEMRAKNLIVKILLAGSYYRISKNFYSEFRKTIYRKTISFTEKLFCLPKNFSVYR